MRQVNCIKCGKAVTYKTKPPKWCKQCKPKKKGYKKKWTHKGSKEALMFKILNQVFPDEEYINNGYYSWLLSPRSAPMQLDRYYPKLKLAFEYMGSQHYEFNKYFHRTKDAFVYLQECDIIKRKICKDKGISLIEIRHDEDITIDLIKSKLEGGDV